MIRTVLTDNWKEFIDRFCAAGEHQPTGRHAFAQTRDRHGIEHSNGISPLYRRMAEKNSGHVTPVAKLKEYHRIKLELFQNYQSPEVRYLRF